MVCGQGCAHRGRWRVDEPKCLLSGMPLWALVTFSRGTAAASGLGDSAREPWGVPGQRQMYSQPLFLSSHSCHLLLSLCPGALSVISLPFCGHIPSWDQRSQPASACFPHTLGFCIIRPMDLIPSASQETVYIRPSLAVQ